MDIQDYVVTATRVMIHNKILVISSSRYIYRDLMNEVACLILTDSRGVIAPSELRYSSITGELIMIPTYLMEY